MIFATILRELPGLAAAACLVLLTAAAGASAAIGRDVAVDPGTRVNGILVVQGLARDADAELFGVVCDPVVLRPGRRTRSCGRLPAVRRIFVGHGMWAPEEEIDSAWKSSSWELWIDGRRVSLRRFGHADRWLRAFAPAGYEDVVLREWSVILVGARGRHSIRYRTLLPQGVGDTTWRFTVGTK